MISSEVQRTLVKSPPELWSELSDEAALARHLSGFERVRITNRSAEERIDWAADGARGSIVINPSGWGTRVTLTLERDSAAPAAAAPKPEPVLPADAPQTVPPEAAPQPGTAAAPSVAPTDAKADPSPAAAPLTTAPEPAAPADAQPAHDRAPKLLAPFDAPATAAGAVEPERASAAPETPESPPPADDTAAEPRDVRPRRGIFARLVSGWQRALEWAERPSDAPQPTPDPPRGDAVGTAGGGASGEVAPGTSDAAPETSPPARGVNGRCTAELPGASPTRPPAAAPPPGDSADETNGPLTHSPPPQPRQCEEKDLSAELRAAEEAASEGDAAVLTAVLDSLGSAHHRPFSRS